MPWPDNSVEEIVLNHVLEHLGTTSSIYFKILQELYRICASDAQIHIAVPHPRHNDFISDPTHVRAVTIEELAALAQDVVKDLAKRGCADSPVAEFIGVDFVLEKYDYVLDDYWIQRFVNQQLPEDQLEQELQHSIRSYNNVVKEIRMILRVKK